MTSLKALARLRRVAGKPPPSLPLVSLAAQAAQQIVRLSAPRQPLPPPLLTLLQERLAEAQRLYSWRRLKRSEWRLSPLLLWRGDPPLITRFGLFDRVLSRLQDDRTGTMTRRLIEAWLAAYGDDMPKRTKAAAARPAAIARPCDGVRSQATSVASSSAKRKSAR